MWTSKAQQTSCHKYEPDLPGAWTPADLRGTADLLVPAQGLLREKKETLVQELQSLADELQQLCEEAALLVQVRHTRTCCCCCCCFRPRRPHGLNMIICRRMVTPAG